MAKLHPIEVKQTPELLQSRESEILKILELGKKIPKYLPAEKALQMKL